MNMHEPVKHSICRGNISMNGTFVTIATRERERNERGERERAQRDRSDRSIENRLSLIYQLSARTHPRIHPRTSYGFWLARRLVPGTTRLRSTGPGTLITHLFRNLHALRRRVTKSLRVPVPVPVPVPLIRRNESLRAGTSAILELARPTAPLSRRVTIATFTPRLLPCCRSPKLSH